MSSGTIKFFNSGKKFGFITPDDGGKEIYLSASALSSGSAATLKPGQRVSFDREVDPRGEKAVNIKLLKQAPAAAPKLRQNVTIYLDSTLPESETVKSAVCTRSHHVAIVDYTTTQLTADELKRMALLLNGSGMNLVRRYHPMFRELRLDDRFISESEYWTAVAEHPVLIDGPIVVAGTRAGICKSLADVESVFGEVSKSRTDEKPKQISARLAAMLSGVEVIPPKKAKPAPVLLSPDKVAAATTKVPAPQSAKPKAVTKVRKEMPPTKKASRAEKSQKSPTKKTSKAMKKGKPTKKAR